MKSPEELATRLARQWSNADLRESRLLNGDCWPIRLSLGKPTAREITNKSSDVRTCIKKWREVRIGRVIWKSVRYRSLAEELSVPVAWEFDKPSEWIEAANNRHVREEAERLSRIISEIDTLFHSFVIRQRHLVTHTAPDDIIMAARVAMTLEPGIGVGMPLRSLPVTGIDSKFFERNRSLMTRLLDIRFQGAASDIGLETFLDASSSSAQWLLIADLDSNLLPFKQVRVRDIELRDSPPPGKRLLIVENEQCHHLLPRVEDTIAILGGGFNLSWMDTDWLSSRQIAYWGDIDTWGLTMLARAREKQPGLTALLMTRAIFDRFQSENAVAERVPASRDAPANLSATEIELYNRLLSSERGRLEQEFLPVSLVQKTILDWVG